MRDFRCGACQRIFKDKKTPRACPTCGGFDLWERAGRRLGIKRRVVPKRVYRCEGCGSDRAPYSSGRSKHPKNEVPDGVARWCVECARKLQTEENPTFAREGG